MATYQYKMKEGLKYNIAQKELGFITDEEITSLNINSKLPNNSSNYDKNIGYIPSFSTIQIKTPTRLIIATFDETKGNADSSEDRPNGEWSILGVSDFKTI